MVNFELDERTLPLSIQKDIKALKECQKPENKNKDIDIYIYIGLNYMVQLMVRNMAEKFQKKLLII